MFGRLKKLFDNNDRAIKEVTPTVDEIFGLEDKVKSLSFEEMRDKIDGMRKELAPILEKFPESYKTSLTSDLSDEFSKEEAELSDKLKSFIPELFAILRETNSRKFGKPHYRVQLIASTILAQGHRLAELKTGEGKTQVFHLPAALYGLTGRGSHVITVNDYLARRDGEYAGHAMADLGITVGVITPQAAYRFVKDEDLAKVKGEEAAKERESLDVSLLSDMRGINLMECTKQEAYEQNVVYGTNNEFGFDYLRDNMVYELKNRVQKELYFCIVDEADSILIDEARTPLIISAPAEASNDLYTQFARIVKKLEDEKHYTADEKSHSVTLTDEGAEYVEKLLNINNIWENYQMAHHLDNALKAEVLYKKDDEYIIKEGEILIVDDFTGRVLKGRRYSDGLHQAIEAKEGVEIKRESKTMATITFQNFFKLYKVLAGGSGTIMTEAEEFASIYNLESLAVPTNRPVIRDDKTDKVYKTKQAKFEAVADEIETINEAGQPILVGTTSVEASEYLSRILDRRGVEHEVLNAKFHEREAAIVSKAGNKGAVTVATNMAGRGTDIPLTKEVLEMGGLYIIGTERHDARRVDNQLRGRAGRQGQPGASQFFVALDDEIMRIQGGDIVKRLMEMANVPDDMPIQASLIGRSIESAQKKMEGHHFDIRKRLVDYDNVMNQQREIFYSRRYNLLDITSQAKLEDQEKAEKASKDIVNNLKDMLASEVESIVNAHFFSDRDDEADKSKLVKDYLDLAPDEMIADAYQDATGNKSTKGILDALTSSIADLEVGEIIELFTKITDTMLDKKVIEFEKGLSDVYKISSLQTMDELWTEHLNVMGDLREGIGLRGYAQRDPLVEYKNEGFAIFEKFVSSINSQIARRILKIRRVMQQPIIETKKLATNEDEVSDVLTGSREMSSNVEKALSSRSQNKSQPKQAQSKPSLNIGRNDPCPCGSGLKYKKCGLINSPKHKA
ncbi:SEC-C domain-containing protein [Candidatus Dojkabacteria bacterium]|uniref:Protein translocase subunit SecA n=1 Tax=Candidatus Dojkabacteria bacterium TaxID=2099670 RepID=A0A955RJ61_9BACT|nr:SEC-C domain-containing protein [Candidatus Dojkabacteria bacterium]